MPYNIQRYIHTFTVHTLDASPQKPPAPSELSLSTSAEIAAIIGLYDSAHTTSISQNNAGTNITKNSTVQKRLIFDSAELEVPIIPTIAIGGRVVEPVNALTLFLQLHNALQLEGAGITVLIISVFNEYLYLKCGLYFLFSGSVIESTSTI